MAISEAVETYSDELLAKILTESHFDLCFRSCNADRSSELGGGLSAVETLNATKNGQYAFQVAFSSLDRLSESQLRH